MSLSEKIDAARAQLAQQQADVAALRLKLHEVQEKQWQFGETPVQADSIKQLELQISNQIHLCDATESLIDAYRLLAARRRLGQAFFGTGAAAFLAHLCGSQLAKPLTALALLFLAAFIPYAVANSRLKDRQRKARLAAALANKPQYVAYSCGAPAWLAVPIYIVFLAAAVAVTVWHRFHPSAPDVANGLLHQAIDYCLFGCACLWAHRVWRALARRLRGHYPDKVLVFANEAGIGTADGFVLPYGELQSIAPGNSNTPFHTDEWIGIQKKNWQSPAKVRVNMTVQPREDIVKQLRACAIAGGAQLAPLLPDGGLVPPQAAPG